jgi:poly(A) polymerase
LLGQFERAWVAAGFPDDPATITALIDRIVAAA